MWDEGMLYGGTCIWYFAKDRELYTAERNRAVKTLSKVHGAKEKRSKTKLLGATVEITIDFRRGNADRYLDFVVLPLHYEIVVNVFRTRPHHLVKFQSSRPIVAIRADSGNYRPIKPPLSGLRTPPFYSDFASPCFRSPTPFPTLALTSRPPLFPASDVRQIARDKDVASREKERCALMERGWKEDVAVKPIVAFLRPYNFIQSPDLAQQSVAVYEHRKIGIRVGLVGPRV
ncbi:hypothetical protein G5I_00511 [Acromyrmex echinatior]|uniref:Uncharacterized protein n=1 Tax=Acromyrmex echinatior TaxID=103372 RepID=F4W522_ACREC|nr:hypothetical protein G5I_00511 [Acromyrmex echinatior]